MTTNELKWYVTSQIGSRVSENKILRNRQLYKRLQSILGTDNIDTILEHLHNMGFTLIEKQRNKVKVEPKPIVKTYYTEPKPYEKSKDTHIQDNLFKQYSTERFFTKNKRYEARIGEDLRKKVKYGLSKPYYRENTDYSSIW